MSKRNKEVAELFKYILLNRGEWGGDYSFTYDEDNEVFYDHEHEFEYQLRDYKILVRACEDTTHTYTEIYENDFDNETDWICEVLSEEVLETLVVRMERKMRG